MSLPFHFLSQLLLIGFYASLDETDDFTVISSHSVFSNSFKSLCPHRIIGIDTTSEQVGKIADGRIKLFWIIVVERKHLVLSHSTQELHRLLPMLFGYSAGGFEALLVLLRPTDTSIR
jgi:hypothetical protein